MPFPDGILLINKPSGPTSYDMIRWIKPKLHGAKVGHAGTLDPLASGLLIVLVGKATRRQSDIMGTDKIYRCALRFGLRTDTGDITGRTVECSSAPAPSGDGLWRLLSTVAGNQTQVPPMYSALKHKGTPLYKLARAGKTVERAPRQVSIKWVEPLGQDGNDLSFRIRCTSGTYVRTLVEDIGVASRAGATMTALERESVGQFNVDQAVSGQQLKDMSEEALAEHVVPLAVLA